MDLERVIERAALANRERSARRAIELCNVALNKSSCRELAARARLERARGFAALGAWQRVEVDCRAAALEPDAGAARALLARSLFELGRLEEAATAVETALTCTGDSSELWLLASNIASSLGRRAAAVSAARHAHALVPSRATLKTLARTLAANGEHAESMDLVTKQLAVTPDDPELFVALGMSRYSLGQSEAAVAALRRALELDADCVEGHCGLGWVLLRLGHYREGFLHHEYRLRSAGDERRFGVPPWRGEDVTGKHVILCAEQGFGDTLQFARYLPLVRRRAARTTFYVARSLVPLLSGNPELGPLESCQPAFGSGDYQTLVMSLPHVLGAGDDTAAEQLPWLFPEPERVARFRARLPAGPKVGLAWQGNPKYAGEPWRSMPFVEFAPLLERFGPRATFISLQKHVGCEQIAAAGYAARVLDWSDEIDAANAAFVDSLAIMSLCDVVLTTDSALAHVAGSAGLSAWVLLSHAADWRWGHAATQTPWYPSLRLFRQTDPGDWRGVIERVSAVLDERLG